MSLDLDLSSCRSNTGLSISFAGDAVQGDLPRRLPRSRAAGERGQAHNLGAVGQGRRHQPVPALPAQLGEPESDCWGPVQSGEPGGRGAAEREGGEGPQGQLGQHQDLGPRDPLRHGAAQVSGAAAGEPRVVFGRRHEAGREVQPLEHERHRRPAAALQQLCPNAHVTRQRI